MSTLALATAPAQAEPDIADRLRAIPGLTIVSESPNPPAGHRFFILSYTQPVDHTRPQGSTFQQRFQLLHRDVRRPMVLHTSGYDMPTEPFRDEPTRLVKGNQISVEQRFFGLSFPEPAEWRHLNIWQAATDHHRIVNALDDLYPAKWIATGGSKGGMASVYHRRFYPNDVDGVVAYVAPNDHVNDADAAYDRFFATAGDDPDCRDRLNGVQVQALQQREDLVAIYTKDAEANGWTFETVGGIDRAFEMTVLGSVWGFWQYAGTPDCPEVPGPDAATNDLYDWIDTHSGWAYSADESIAPYAAYFYQAATQLGWPTLKLRHLRGLTRYSGLDSPNNSLPEELRSEHQALPMLDIDLWVRTQADRMLFVYGEDDPWGAEQFTPSPRDSMRFTAPGANHGAAIADLKPNDRRTATAALKRWAGLNTAETAEAVTLLDRAASRDLRLRR